MREAVEPGLVEAEAARVQGVRERLEAGVLPRATSLDGRTFTFSAPVDMPLQIGGYVRLGTPGVPGLGQVLDRRLQREPGPEVTGDAGPGGYRTRVAFSLTAGHGVVLGEAGPFHDAPITLAGPHDVAAHLAEARPGRARLELGEAMFAPGVPVELDAGGFSRHTFLCGQSGSGKSYALGVVLEQLLMHTGLRIVVLDPNSDYVPLDRARDDAPAEAAARWHELAPAIGPRSLGGQGDRRLRLRFFDLDPATMAAVVRLDPLADREEYGAFLELLEQEGRGRALDELRAQLAGSASPELGRLGDRIRNLGVLGWRSWSASREDGGILDELDRRAMRCLVVDLGSISRPDERAMVSAAVLGRIWARRGDREPVLVVIDEAHNVCPRAPGDPLTALATDVAVRIAAEGRKYGIYLLACTQRPQKVHENVVGQCDNLMLMRMNSPADVAHLAEVFSFAPTTLLQRSGVLRLGEALVAGHVAPHPMFVRVGRRVAAEGGGDVPATWAASPG